MQGSMTSYYDSSHSRPRPLIDLIPDNRPELEDLDEENDIYGREDDFLIPLKWQSYVAHTATNLPRRTKKRFVFLFAALILCIASWRIHFGPQYRLHMEERKDMENAPAMAYGQNVLPEFTNMIKLKDMDHTFLPKKHSRLIFVGDVHGCREELEHLLHKVNFDKKHDHLVLTGDMIAKGPDSPGVIRLAMELGASCVRGNWEDKMLLSISELQDQDLSGDHLISLEDTHEDEVQTAGKHKLRKLAKKFKKSEIAYLRQCPCILRVGEVPNLGSLVVVHAGLVPDIPLERQDPYHVMNMRTIDLKTRKPSSKHDGTPWEKFWNHQQAKLPEEARTTVIYGHNGKKGLNIRDYSYGLDTGCVKGDRLTALVVNAQGKTDLVHVRANNPKGYDLD